MRSRTPLLGLLVVLAEAATFAAAPLNQMNYQGVLRDGGGQPLDGTFDMVFRFFDDATLGSEALVDSHLQASGHAVTVTGGLFNVALGSAVVTDGSGPGTFNFLTDVFRTLGEVWLEIEIDGEVLLPRVLLLPSAGAFNSHSLSGIGANQFLRADQSTTFAGGTFSVATGELGMGTGAPATKVEIVDGSLALTGGDGTWGGLWLKTQHLGSSSNHHMILRGEEDPTHAESISIYHRNATPTDDPGTAERGFRVLWDGTTMIGSTAAAIGNPTTGGRLYVGGTAQIAQGLRVGSLTAAPTYSHFGAGTPDVFSWVTTPDDVYVSDDLEVDGFAGFNGSIFVKSDGADQIQHVYFMEGGTASAEELSWNDTFQRFEFSDDLSVAGGGMYGSNLFVSGNITKSGTVAFLQNHPERADLSVRYVALEGAEAGTYTRGSARLENGEARIELEQPFTWTTNPDIGLTAQVTPRGRGAALYVASVTSSELVVRALEGSPADAEFDYLVHGLRIGHETYNPVELRGQEARVPVADHYDRRIATEPQLAAYRPLERFLEMRDRAGETKPLDLSATLALRRAIGEWDPDAGAPAETFHVPAVRPQGGTVETPSGANLGTADDRPSVPSPQRAARDADPTGTLYAASVRPAAAELAGYFPVSEPVEVGDVLVLDLADPGKMRRGSTAGDPAVFGIVAGEPGLLLGSGIERIASADPDLARRLDEARAAGDREAEIARWTELEKKFEEAHAPVALSGVVPCKVDATYGAIRAGDLLSVSATRGHAMRAEGDLPGTIVGKALEPFEEGTGVIRVLVLLR